MSEAVERLVEQLAIPTVLPHQEIHDMVVTGPDQYMGRLSEMLLTNESVWQVVRTAAYGWREGNRFTRFGVIPFIAPCDDKDLSVPANALERLTDLPPTRRTKLKLVKSVKPEISTFERY